MNIKKLSLKLILSFLLLSLTLNLWGQNIGKQIPLEKWHYREAKTSEWRSCKVPSMVQENLINDGLLPDPFYRDNEEKVQWVDKKDWVYSCEFNFNDNISSDKPYFLEFDGLDTYCRIVLNGEILAETDNMFRLYKFNVNPYLRQGKNILDLVFHSPLKKAKPLYDANGFNYPADNDHAEEHMSPFTRKAPYNYGWDWGMRLLSMGVWRDIRLCQYDKVKIENILVYTKEIKWQGNEAKSAMLNIRPELTTFKDGNYKYVLEVSSPISNKTYRYTIPQSRINDFSIKINKPALWWTREWGKANLYKLNLIVLDEANKKLASKSLNYGIRELKFVNEFDEVGKSFYFVLNKRPIFIKGANYIPGEQILTLRTREKLERLFEDAKFANFNMLRIWGGGVYESDEFYDLADENGILIWQDFMFACTPYPDSPEFLANVEAEARDQVKRIQNHPCIALWCGNNEIKEGLYYWGWQKRFKIADYDKMLNAYKPLFQELLPKVVSELAQQSYIHGSPIESNWGNKESYAYSDNHYWGLWYGREDFDTFEHKPLRFVSEYGFQAFPTMKSILHFAPKAEDLNLDSKVMKTHQKASTGNGLIKTYIEKNYVLPKEFHGLVYLNNVVQMEGMEQVMRILRMKRPTCMGSIYWQFNDSWASISWSGIDYYHNYKGLHYGAKRAYAPINLSTSVSLDKDSLRVFVNNDYLKDEELSFTINIRSTDNSFENITPQMTVNVGANSSQLVATMDNLHKKLDDDKKFVVVDLYQAGKHIDRMCYYPKKIMDMHLPEPKLEKMSYDYNEATRELKVKIVAGNTLLKNLFLETGVDDLNPIDNYVDILPREEYTYTIKNVSKSQLEVIQFKFIAVNNKEGFCEMWLNEKK